MQLIVQLIDGCTTPEGIMLMGYGSAPKLKVDPKAALRLKGILKGYGFAPESGSKFQRLHYALE